MEIKILQVFYGKDGLPYKDKERQVHFPITGTGFLGASNTTKIKFYYDELDNLDETTWVAVSKLPNGKLGSRVLESHLDSELNEHYALLELDNYYTQYKGDVFISLQGYQGGVNLDYNEETSLYEIHGTPTIAATGSIKFTINYANQFVGSGETDNVNFQRILADLGTKLGMRAYSEHVEELPSVGQSDIFYVVNDDPSNPNLANIYIWNSETKHYIWVGNNTLNLGDYYTQEQGDSFEEDVNNRVANLESQLQSVASGSPRGVYATVSALTTADPSHNYIYIVSDDGHWYYWDGTQWADGGAYLSNSLVHYDPNIVLTAENYLSYEITSILDIPNGTNVAIAHNITNSMISGLPIYGVGLYLSKFSLDDGSGWWAIAIEQNNSSDDKRIWFTHNSLDSYAPWREIYSNNRLFKTPFWSTEINSSNYSSYGITSIDNIPTDSCLLIGQDITSQMISGLPQYGYYTHILKINSASIANVMFAFGFNGKQWYRNYYSGGWVEFSFTNNAFLNKSLDDNVKNKTLSYQFSNIVDDLIGENTNIALDTSNLDNGNLLFVNNNKTETGEYTDFAITPFIDISAYAGKKIIIRGWTQPSSGDFTPCSVATFYTTNSSLSNISSNRTKPVSWDEYNAYQDRPVYMVVSVPSNAVYMRQTIRVADISMWGIFELKDQNQKLPYQSGVIAFTVPVNQNNYNTNSDSNTVQDSETISNVDCVLRLPSTYSANGKPTKLCMVAHGAGSYVNGSNWSDVDNDWLVENGFAIFDTNGSMAYADEPSGLTNGQCLGSPRAIMAYHKAYEYIVKNYNVEPQLYIFAYSMGGLASLNFINAFPQLVKCVSLVFPVTDLYGQAWQHPWLSDTKQRIAIEYWFNDQTGNTWESDKVVGFNPIDNKSIGVSNNKHNIFPIPIKIWHGKADTVVNYQGSVKFINALKNAGCICSLRLVDGVGHNLDWLSTYSPEVLLWFKRWE